VNWHPKTINKTIRFLRYFKLVKDAITQQRDIIKMLSKASCSVGGSPGMKKVRPFESEEELAIA